MILEVVLERIEEINAIAGYDIDRVELVSALDVGGLTPSIAMVSEAVNAFKDVQVMIRPRTGGFTYSSREISAMGNEIRVLADYGIKGVVFGCLDRQSRIDKPSFENLFKIARDLNLESTFHRAIDFCSNKMEALEFLQNTGVNRLLSAGSTTTIESGYSELKNILKVVKDKVRIIAAGGIDEKNVVPLLGLDVDVHIAIRKKNDSKNEVYFGGEYDVDYSKIEYFSSLRHR